MKTKKPREIEKSLKPVVFPVKQTVPTKHMTVKMRQSETCPEMENHHVLQVNLPKFSFPKL